MNIKDINESLEYLFNAELTPFLWGHRGLGKTTVPKEYAKQKGWKFFPLYLGTQSDLGDVLGLAEFVDNGDGSKSTAFAIPKWLNDIIVYCNDNPESGAIIFLDELNRARRDILNGMFSLALDKRFHTLQLPKNCHIIAAGNPPTDEYVGLTDIDDSALMSRFVHIKFEPTFQEWAMYAKNTEMDRTLIEFVKNQPNLLEESCTEFKLPIKVDRRSWSRLDRLFQLKTPYHLLEQLMVGIIGLERTVAYQQFLRDQEKPLTAQEVLTGQKKELLEKWSNPSDVVASLVNLTCDNLKEELAKRNEKKENLTDVEKKALMDFLLIIPKDISYPFIKAVVDTRNDVFKNFFTTAEYEKPITDLVRAIKPKAA